MRLGGTYGRVISRTRDIRTDDNFERKAIRQYEWWKECGLTHGRTDQQLLIHACRYIASEMINNALFECDMELMEEELWISQ